MVLEKAYAKFYGSYADIKSGHSINALRDLTGAPSFDYLKSKEDVWWEKMNEGN